MTENSKCLWISAQVPGFALLCCFKWFKILQGSEHAKELLFNAKYF